jgi:peptide/nickel transport system permease protein
VTSFLARRLLSAVPTLLGITLVTFLILDMLPGDPLVAGTIGAAIPSAEVRDRLGVAPGAERGPLQRYFAWAGALLRADLGRSLRDGRPVGQVVSEALPWTLLLNLFAIAAIYGLAVPFGVLGAVGSGSRIDRFGGAILLILYALPAFAAALTLQEIVAVRLRLLPLHGVGDLPAGAGLLDRALDLLRHLVLPAACLALSGWAFVARYTRAAFLGVLGREFLATARAKGVSRLRAYRHAAAGTAVSLVTLLAAIIPGLAGGSVIVEEIFSWPGLGRAYLTAVEGRDSPVVLGLTLLSAVLVLAAQLLVDLLYVLVDPRIREGMLGGGADA